MATYQTLQALFQDMADAIRNRNSLSTLYYPNEMPDAIRAITIVHNQNKSATPTENSQTISADTGYTGLGTVTVGAISSNYVGSGIARKGSSDLTVNGATVTVPAGYYASQATKSVTTASHPNPSISLDSTTGLITVTHTQTAGYVTAGSTTDTLQLTTQAGSTTTPNSTTQTLVAAGTYTLGDIKVAAVPTETKTATSNGTVTPSAGKYLSSVTVNVPSDLVTQTKTVTPTKSQQTVSPDTGYNALSSVTVNAIPTQYITTTDANAVAANILLNKTAYVNGSKITGSMPNNGVTGTTITTQGGTYTIPAGYTSGGTVTANLTASTITNSAINGTASLEDTNDYAFSVSINIPAGYYNATSLTKNFSSILPAPESEGTSSHLVSGYDLYNHDGRVISGAMANNGAWNRTLDQTTTSATIPAGYHDGTGTVSHTTVSVPNPTISVNTSTGVITASGSWTRGFTTNNSYSNTSNLSTQAGTTITPTESEQTAVAANKYTLGAVKVAAIPTDYVGSGITSRSSADLTASGATVSVPAGYYAEAASKSVSTTTHPDPTVSINTTTGVVTASHAQTAGYVSAGTTTKTLSLTTQAGTTITPTESEQTAVAANVYTLGNVKIGAISSTYVGSGIVQRSSSDLTASGATVTVPAGYYASQATKSVTTMTLPTSASSSATSGYTSKATISRSTSDQYINIPPGYNSAGGYYKINAVANGTASGPSSVSGTAATVSNGTNTLTLTKTVSITPVVSAGYISSGTATNATVTLTANVTTKAAATITPGTSNQTIASGTYLTGTQTIAGDADLVAGNIKTGVEIFGVTGTYSGLDTSDATATAADIVSGETAYVDGRMITGNLVVQTYYTGNTAPASSLGQNGDIYLRSQEGLNVTSSKCF